MTQDPIHIKPSHEGRFTEFAKAYHTSVHAMAAKVKANPDEFSTSRSRQANFALNFGGK